MQSKNHHSRHEGGTMAFSMMDGGAPKGRQPKSETILRQAQVRILVVDDDGDMRDTLSMILEGKGYSATTAPDGADGLALFRAGKFDVVVSDYHMVTMHGPEMFREIRKIDARVPLIIAFGGSKEEEDIARDAGACAVLKKPFDIEALDREIKKALLH